MTEQEEQAPFYHQHTDHDRWSVISIRKRQAAVRCQMEMHSGYVILAWEKRWNGNLNWPFSIGMWQTHICGHLGNHFTLLNALDCSWEALCIYMKLGRDLSYCQGGFTELSRGTMAVYPSGSWSLSYAGQLSWWRRENTCLTLDHIQDRPHTGQRGETPAV